MRSYLTESLGAFFLVFTVLSTVAASSGLAAASVGTVLVGCVWAGAHVSGGHFNPAVTFGVFLRGGLSVLDLWSYWAAQLAGALLAAVVALVVLPRSTPSAAHSGDRLLPLGVVEFVFTFALVFVMLSIGASRRQQSNVFLGVSVGVVVLGGMLAISALDVGAFNPAVAFGMSVDGAADWLEVAVYVLAELVAAGAAAALAARVPPD